MNWYKKAQVIENPVQLYHVTSPFSAERIMQVGFDPNLLSPGNAFSFTKKDGVKKWAKILQKERIRSRKTELVPQYIGLDHKLTEDWPPQNEAWKEIKIIEVTIPQRIYDTLHRLGDEIQYRGYKEVYEYSKGWKKENVVPLKGGVNCKIRLLTDEEVNELV